MHNRKTRLVSLCKPAAPAAGRASLAAAESWQKARGIVDDDRDGSFTSPDQTGRLSPFAFCSRRTGQYPIPLSPRAVEPNRERCSMPELRYSLAGGGTSTSQAEETIDGSHLGRSQSHPAWHPGKSTGAEHQDQRRDL